MASIQCYNRGCGQKYSPRINPEDACQFHPGAPFFHETYKGWTCCNKKFSDFTEFLNTPGCAKGPHSNVKPEEPEHITGQVGDANNIDLPQVSENVPDRESFESRVRLERPDFDKTQLTRLKPTIAASLAQSAKNLTQASSTGASQEIPIGEPCKNGGCKLVSLDNEFLLSTKCICKYFIYVGTYIYILFTFLDLRWFSIPSIRVSVSSWGSNIS